MNIVMGGTLQSHDHYIEYLIESCRLDKSLVYKGIKNSTKLNVIDLQNIANNLKIHISHLVHQSVDIDYLDAFHNEGTMILPKSFKKGAFSSTTSLNSVIEEFIEYEKYEDALMYLQITPELLKSHERISITVVHDLIQFMQRYIDDEKLTNIGKRNADAFLKTNFFGDVFYDCLNNKRPGESLFENVHLVERNWSYQIQKSNNGCIKVRTSQTEQMNDICPDAVYTNSNTNKVRFEFIRRILEKVGYQSSIKQTSYISKNGSFNFEVEYTKFKRPAYFPPISVFQ